MSPSVLQTMPPSWFAELLRSLRSMPAYARLALGRRGVTVATIAAAVGLSCVIAVFAVVALSLRTTEVASHRQSTIEILDIDRSFRDLMRRTFALSAGGSDLQKHDISLQQHWESFDAALTRLCARDSTKRVAISGVASICETGNVLRTRLLPELSSFDPPRRPIDAGVMSNVFMMSALLNDASEAAARDADATVDRLVGHYDTALLVLVISTAGFVAAGLVLFVLVGRASVLFHAQWRRVRETRDLLQETLDALPAGVVLYDKNERLLMFNAVAADVTPGLRRWGALGMTYEELVHANARELEASGGTLHGTPEDWIARFRSKGARRMRQMHDGRWFDWVEKATPSGGTVGLRVDITEVKRLELEAERHREEYESLVDSLSDLVFKLDFNTGRFTFASGSGGRFAGIPTDQLVGMSFTEFVASTDVDRVSQFVRAARAANGAVQEIEFLVDMAQGEPRFAEMRFRITDEGAAEVLSGVIRDVTKETELRSRLDSEMARLRAIIESSGALILLTDADLTVLAINREFTSFWGVTSEYMLGQRLSTSSTGTGLDPEAHRRWLAGENLDPVRFVRTQIDAQGRRRILNVTASPITDEEGRVRQIVFLGVDDTDRTEAEQALFQAERLATVGEMAATIVHEIAQPLQVIDLARSGAEEELAQANEEGRTADSKYIGARLERIGAQIKRANRLVGDVRAFVRGTSQEVAEKFDPADAVRGAIELARHGFRQTNVTVSLATPQTLPAIVGNIGKLEQVLINLVNNARDAGAQAIEVVAETQQLSRGDFLRLAVMDNGPGIPASVLPRLFEKFITTKPRGQGTGLGLRICRRIIEEMGGTISASNRPEGGACFEIFLPIAGDSSADAAASAGPATGY